MALGARLPVGQYLPGESAVHRLDPRTKIIWTLLWMVTLFGVGSFAGYVSFGVFLVAVLVLARIPVRAVWRGIRPLMYLILFTAFFNLLATPGQPVVRLGPLAITDAGLVTAGLVTARLLLLIAGASILTLTTSPLALSDGIETLLRPLQRIGLPAHELAMMMAIALRFIPTLLEEAERIMKAQKARGADFESGSIQQRIRSLLPVLVPLFVSAFRRADELAVAMEARAYRGGAGRTHLRELHFQPIDLLWMAVSLLWLVGTAAVF
ncbi:MAG: energy-coupling factor transporter transmembrane protein EcfT [Limnochordales bacterium]|nr:energy-coupling factor transporter transmembrane protein EcfT [Limnochordales bacterium]